jgi:hypothetical protein
MLPLQRRIWLHKELQKAKRKANTAFKELVTICAKEVCSDKKFLFN